MAKITFLKPSDPPAGRVRLLPELKTCLSNPSYNTFRCAVAFVKSGPLLRLEQELKSWRHAGKKISGVFGVDHQMTTLQGLNLVLKHFNEAYITYVSGKLTFHPKIYLFSGDEKACCYLGSHNLTVGGTETNFEGGVKLEFDLRSELDEFKKALECWEALLPGQCTATRVLDQKLINDLLSYGLIVDETAPSEVNNRRSQQSRQQSGRSPLFPIFRAVPPTSLPMGALRRLPRAVKRRGRGPTLTPTTMPLAEALIIQVIPHHNGEIFLSMLAINQNPAFFGFPFAGRTQPKKAGRAAYPQRIPDPRVNIMIFDQKDQLVTNVTDYPLNTVFYERKSEIRITVSPQMARQIPSHSIMVMSRTNSGDPQDYNIEVYPPGSPEFARYLVLCTQTLPSGGSRQPRKMGWL